MLSGMIVLNLAVAIPRSSFAQLSDDEYVRQALAAGPEPIARGAAVVRPEADGNMRTIRQGTNGFTCLIMDTDRMCADKNSMEFIHALMHHQPRDVEIDDAGAGLRKASSGGADRFHKAAAYFAVRKPAGPSSS
jgi:hypothetical protein